MQKVLGFAMMLVSGVTIAGWFGPSTYDECILDGMKGVASNTAAVAIAQACRSKFPLPPPTPKSAEELAKEKEENIQACRSYNALMIKKEREKKLEKEEYDKAMQKFLLLEGPAPMPPAESPSLLSSMEEYRGARACRDSQ